ncbi:hypothetical protein [Sorangium sp. So ce1153]|uniref:hypothetical protein n=1 Tax=Sorangium sp. So ce1153 TaxID=3133333 RepID=UPI003F604CBA
MKQTRSSSLNLMNTTPSSLRRLRARLCAAAAVAALLAAAPEARAQLCWGTNCPPPRPAQGSAGGNAGGNAGAGAQGGTRGTVVWDPWTGKWIPQVVIQGQAGAGAQGQASGHAQGQIPPPPPPPSPPPPPPIQPAPTPAPTPRYSGGGGEIWTYRFRPYLGVGGCIGFQLGIADEEVRFLQCARVRLQPWPYVGFGVDGTYTLGADDEMSSGQPLPPELEAYRHEFYAWPYLSIHPFGSRMSPYVRLGANIGTAILLGEGWSEDRSYLGGHAGLGFDATMTKHGIVTMDILGFRVTRLDDLPRPDGREGRGGWGMQMRLTVSYAFLL